MHPKSKRALTFLDDLPGRAAPTLAVGKPPVDPYWGTRPSRPLRTASSIPPKPNVDGDGGRSVTILRYVWSSLEAVGPPLDLKPFCETPAKVFCGTLDRIAVLTKVQQEK